MLNILTKNSLNYGWVGANHAHFEKQFREKWRQVSLDDIIKNISTQGCNKYFIDVWLIIFIILGRPSKGEYSGLSNAEECKLYRSKGSEQKKKNDALRKK